MSSDSGDKKGRRKGIKSVDSTQELPLGWPTAQFQRTQMGVDSHLNIEVVSASSELAAAVEEAAIFYANAQSAEAKDSLSHAVQKENLAPAAERLWLMLLDLHRELGERAEFDARAQEYANRFECDRQSLSDQKHRWGGHNFRQRQGRHHRRWCRGRLPLR